MAKKGLILLLLLATILTFTSCGLDYRYSLDEDLHEQIDIVLEDDQPSYIIYQDHKYLFVGTTGLFRVDRYVTDDGYGLPYKEDVMLSWNGFRYVWYIEEYYSYTAEDPLFIYESRLRWVYFREDYDYTADVFVISECDAEIVWNDIFVTEQTSIDFASRNTITLYSKQYPRIETTLEIAFFENQWYMTSRSSQKSWTLSDEFINLLSENGLI